MLLLLDQSLADRDCHNSLSAQTWCICLCGSLSGCCLCVQWRSTCEMTVIVCLLPHATISLMVTTALQATCDPGTTRGTHSQQVNNTDASISTYLHIVLCVCVSVYLCVLAVTLREIYVHLCFLSARQLADNNWADVYISVILSQWVRIERHEWCGKTKPWPEECPDTDPRRRRCPARRQDCE